MLSLEKRSRVFAKRILGRVLYHSGLFDLFCRVCRKREIVILMYHKTCYQTDDPVELNVRPEILDKQISALMEHTEFISLDQAVEKIRSRQIKRHYTVLTFDDGYRSNYQYAYPVLTKYDVPCTFFLSVGAMETGQFYWEIINAVVMNEKNTQVMLGNERKGERVLDLTGAGGRSRAIQEIHDFVKGLKKHEITELIARLKQDYSIDERHLSPIMNWEDLANLSGNLISFGSHGVSHVILTKMDPEDMGEEIERSKKIIEGRTGRRISAFAYPNGEPLDYNESIIERIKQAGYTSALTAVHGTVGADGIGLFTLPRIHVTERMSLGADGRFSKALFLCKIFRLF